MIVVCYTSRGSPDLTTRLATLSAGALHPLYRELATRSVSEEVGHRISFVRQSHGLSRGVVAKVLDISARQLAAIESGRRSPGLGTLYAVARAFRRPLEYFLPEGLDDARQYALLRRTEIVRQPPWWRADRADGTRYFPLSAGLGDRGMYPYYAQLASASGHAPQQFPGEQFVYLLQGEVEFSTSASGHAARELLRPGDSLYFDTSIPHELRARTKSPFGTLGAEMIAVFWSPLGEPAMTASA